MTADRGYASPAAFRRALTDRLRVLAKEGKWTLTQLQRQMAYDRLTAARPWSPGGRCERSCGMRRFQPLR